MALGKDIVIILQNNNNWMTVNEIKNSLNGIYASKQVGTEIRRIKEWSILGKNWIDKVVQTRQNLRKNGKMGKVRYLNCYRMKDEAKVSHIDVLLSLTRGPAFNHHNYKIGIKKAVAKRCVR